MAQQQRPLPYRQRTTPDEILREVAVAYGHITPPSDRDVEEVYGRCLLATKEELNMIQDRLNHTEHTMGQALLQGHSPQDDTQPSHTTQFDVIHEQLNDISEQVKTVEDRTDEIFVKVVNMDDAITDTKERLADRAGSVSGEIDEVDRRLGSRIDDVEKAQHDMEHEILATIDPKLISKMADFKAKIISEIADFRVKLISEMADFKTEMRSEMEDFEAKLISEMEDFKAELRSEMAGFRTEMEDLRIEMEDFKTELRSEIAGLRCEMADLRREMADFKAEMRSDMADLRREMADFKAEMRSDMADFKAEMRSDMAGLRREMADFKADMVMWFESMDSINTAKQQNLRKTRLYDPVMPVGIRYKDVFGRPAYKTPPGPLRSVKYYWKMQQPKNHEKLIALHHFYEMDYRHWACFDTYDSDSDDGETQSASSQPETLPEAVEKYPERAVEAIFDRLGLHYAIFRDQLSRHDIREQRYPGDLGKRSPESSSSRKPATKKKRNSSSGSTAEFSARKTPSIAE